MAVNNGSGSFDELFITPNGNIKSNGERKQVEKATGKNRRTDDINHDHPACENDHVHEKAYVTSSAGGEITEGCVEHYFDRIVSTEEIVETVKTDGKLAEYIVMGEILLNPKFKRRWR